MLLRQFWRWQKNNILPENLRNIFFVTNISRNVPPCFIQVTLLYHFLKRATGCFMLTVGPLCPPVSPWIESQWPDGSPQHQSSVIMWSTLPALSEARVRTECGPPPPPPVVGPEHYRPGQWRVDSDLTARHRTMQRMSDCMNVLPCLTPPVSDN